MIFYFSGTGNSKFIANCIADRFGESPVEITAALNSTDLSFGIKDDERVGIISPVYWYGLPMEVINFAKKLKLNNYKGQYVYCFATYGGSAGRFAENLEDILKAKGYVLNGKYGVKMADNYILGYTPAPLAEQIKTNNEAVKIMKTYLYRIEARENANLIKRGAMAFISPLIRPIYEKGNRSKKFYVTSDCTSCGLCSRNCPCGAISMKDRKPSWNSNCSQCVRCIHSCPVKAIQYGKGTIKRERYLFDEKTIKS